MKSTTLETFDATIELGLPVEIHGRVPGVYCSDCETFAVRIAVLEEAADTAVAMLLEQPRLLSGREAKFLRRRALVCSQTSLAEKLGFSRPTVARWERSRSLASKQDFELRALVLSKLLGKARERPMKTSRYLLELGQRVLSGVRERPAPKRLPKLRVAA